MNRQSILWSLLVLATFPCLASATTYQFTTNPITDFSKFSYNATGFERYITVSATRVSTQTWNITLFLDPALQKEITVCYNEFHGFDMNATCDLEHFKQRWLVNYTINNQTLFNVLSNIDKVPIVRQNNLSQVSVNNISYLAAPSFTVTFSGLDQAISIGFGTITTFLPSSTGVASWESAFDETTLTQDAGSGPTTCDATCISQTNVSDDTRFTTQYGDASDDAYFGVNWTLDVSPEWAEIKMEGQQEDANIQCGLAIWNWTSGTWRAVNLTTCTTNTDVTLRFNITSVQKANFVNSTNNMIRTVFYTNDSAANTLKMDYAGLQIKYNASVLWNTPAINASTVLTGASINHTVSFNTSGNLSAFKFEWNGTGASCTGGFQNVTNSTFTGPVATAFANHTIPSACAGKQLGWRFWANNTDGSTNTTSLQTYQVYTLGLLNVTNIVSTSPTNLSINTSVSVNASVTCLGTGAVCTVVVGTVRLNLSGVNPAEYVNTTTPFRLMTAGADDDKWNMSLEVNDKNSSDLSGTDSKGVFINDSGTGMYVSAYNTGRIKQYSLSTPWDVSTASFVQQFVTTSEDSFPYQVYINSSGTGMFMVGNNVVKVFQYRLSTPWDVSTASFTSSFSTVGEEPSPVGAWFNGSGKRMYVVGVNTPIVRQYNLATPWDVTSATYSKGFDIASGALYKVALNPSGTRMYVLDHSNNKLITYNLTTPWEIDSASLIPGNLSFNDYDTSTAGLFFKTTTGDLFVVDDQHDKILGYTYTTTDTNPKSCGTINEEQSCNVSWVLNYTGALGSSYAVDVLFNSTTYPSIATNNTIDRIIQNVTGPFVPSAVITQSIFLGNKQPFYLGNGNSLYLGVTG